jgi:hypothetical protein
VSRVLSFGEAAAALSNAGWPAVMIPQMIAIGLAESGLRVDAVSPKNRNGTTDRGWLQINSVHGYDAGKLTSDPVYTAAAGLNIWKSQGLRAWSTYNSGKAGPTVVARVADGLKKFPNVKPIDNPGNGPDLSPGELVQAGSGAVDAVTAGAKGVGDLVGAVTNRHTWVRVVEVVAGLGMVVAGGVLLSKGTVQAAGKAVAGAVPGAAASAVVTKGAGAVAGAL